MGAEPVIPAPPTLRFWRLKIRLRWGVVAILAVVTRARCMDCGERPVYSWYGNAWPQDWLCRTCTDDLLHPEVGDYGVIRPGTIPAHPSEGIDS